MGRWVLLVAWYAAPVWAADIWTHAKAILEKRCLGCHSAEVKTAGLSLASRDSAVAKGALNQAQPQSSPLLVKVLEGRMPPGNPLPQPERDTLRAWIEQGAPWGGTIGSARQRAGDDWWSLQPLRVVTPPDPAGLPASWSRSAIDRFVFARLREKGLTPSPAADRVALIRRATFDLTGLPPTPAEVDAFVQDTRPGAWERVIDRLLASPHYGERWGRHWLDVVRFGESNGYEQNHLRDRAWPFRDYVIRSLNADKPFHRMILEQLAADQIAPDDLETLAATGFLVAGVHDTVFIQNEDGRLQQRANDLDDIVTAVGAGFLGLTVNCARCHDHKFDPIPQADYFRLQAVFAGVEHGEREWAGREAVARRRAEEAGIQKRLNAARAQRESLRQAVAAEVEARRASLAAQYRPAVDARWNEERFAPVQVRRIRLTIHAMSRQGTAGLDEIEVWTTGNRNAALGAPVTADSTRSSGTGDDIYNARYITDGRFDKAWFAGRPNQARITIELPQPVTVDRITWSRDRNGAFPRQQMPSEFVWEGSLDGEQWFELASSRGRLPYDLEAREALFVQAVLNEKQRAEWEEAARSEEEAGRQRAALPKLPMAYLGKFVQPAGPTRIHKRGNPSDPGDVVAPGGLHALRRLLPVFELDPNAGEGERRLALARWIADDRNALTLRVIVNRLWQHHFGAGLVNTPSDFGLNGERPVHPELLDWLAARFRDLGWRWKALHREILLTATYQQATAHQPANFAIDGESRYLWRYPPRRLEAEAVRDAILAVSGTLDRRLGGPGFRLFKYTVDNVATYLPAEDFGPATWRRAVYQQAARSVKDDLLGPFDCPDSSLPEPKRSVTTTPVQALSLLNHRFVMEQARSFARRLEREAGQGGLRAQVELGFRLAFSRRPQAEEMDAAITLIRTQGLVLFTRALLNANEFIYLL